MLEIPYKSIVIYLRFLVPFLTIVWRAIPPGACAEFWRYFLRYHALCSVAAYFARRRKELAMKRAKAPVEGALKPAAYRKVLLEKRQNVMAGLAIQV